MHLAGLVCCTGLDVAARLGISLLVFGICNLFNALYELSPNKFCLLQGQTQTPFHDTVCTHMEN